MEALKRLQGSLCSLTGHKSWNFGTSGLTVTEDAICLGFNCSEKSLGARLRKIFQGFCKKVCLYLEKSIPTGMHLFQFLFLAKITPCQSSGNLCQPPSSSVTHCPDPSTCPSGTLEPPAQQPRQPQPLP